MVKQAPWSAVKALLDALDIVSERDHPLRLTIYPQHVDVLGKALDHVTGEPFFVLDEKGEQTLGTHLYRIPIVLET